MNETDILQSIRIKVGGRYDTRIFRNNVGSLRDVTGRHVTFGLCPGSSDLIGYQSVEITPDMVGKKVAIFLAIEVKGERGKATPQQEQFIERVRDDGGLAGIARSPDDALAILHTSDNLL